jgi:hypothetical protein
MIGIAFLAILTIGVAVLLWVTRLLPTWKTRAAFLTVALGGLAFYPFAYRYSDSYAQFLALCDLPDRYKVVSTKRVDFIFLDRELGADCRAGPSVMGALPYSGFDCVAPGPGTTTAVFRYAKKASWQAGCGLDCFDSSVIGVPEHRYVSGHRQGYISRSVVTVTYETGRSGGENIPSGEKLRFSDTLLLETNTEKGSLQSDLRKLGQVGGETGTEMAFTRAYTYYPYGSGWARILGAASGSAPTIQCRLPSVQWKLTDVYTPRAGA